MPWAVGILRVSGSVTETCFCSSSSCASSSLCQSCFSCNAAILAAMSKSELAAKIAALQEKQDWHKELLAQLDDEQKQVSVTDPDTRKMPTAHGTIVGYNAQLAVDAKNKLS